MISCMEKKPVVLFYTGAFVKGHGASHVFQGSKLKKKLKSPFGDLLRKISGQ